MSILPTRSLAAAKSGALELSEELPLEFSGTPEALRGQISIHNTGDRHLPLTRFDVLDAVLVSESAPVLVHGPRVGRTLLLRTDETRTVPVTLAVDRHTAPGRYEVEMDLGGRRRQVSLTVLDDLSMSLQPTLLVVPNLQGVWQEKLIVVSNDGNVPLELPDIGGVPLDDERLDCRSLRGALKEWAPREDARFEDFVVEVGRQAHKALQRAGILRVHIEGAPVEVPPGEERTLTLTIKVPSTLHRHTRYVAVAPIFLTDLTFVVVPAPVSDRGVDEHSEHRPAEEGSGDQPADKQPEG